MEVWCQWRPSADGSSDSPQLRTNSPEVRTSPNFPTWSAVIRPKVIKNKNYRLPPQKHSLYELLPACEPAAPELELLAIHGPTKLQSGHFALFRYEKRNILFHGGKKSKSEWSSVTFPGGDRSLQKKSRGRRFWQKKKKQFLGEKYPAGKNSLWKKSWGKRNIPEEIGRQWECVKGSWWKYSWWKIFGKYLGGNIPEERSCWKHGADSCSSPSLLNIHKHGECSKDIIIIINITINIIVVVIQTGGTCFWHCSLKWIIQFC